MRENKRSRNMSINHPEGSLSGAHLLRLKVRLGNPVRHNGETTGGCVRGESLHRSVSQRTVPGYVALKVSKKAPVLLPLSGPPPGRES